MKDVLDKIYLSESHKLDNISLEYDFIFFEASGIDMMKQAAEAAKEFIRKLIQQIKDFIQKVYIYFMGEGQENYEEQLELIVKLRGQNLLGDNNEKVPVILEEKYQDLLNEYCKKMAIINKKLIDLQIEEEAEFRDMNVSNRQALDRRGNLTIGNQTRLVRNSEEKHRAKFEAKVQKLLADADAINKTYDAKLLELAKPITKVAINDLIQYNIKQIKNYRVDFKKFQDGSEKILTDMRLEKLFGSLKSAGASIANRIGSFTQKVTNQFGRAKIENLKNSGVKVSGTPEEKKSFIKSLKDKLENKISSKKEEIGLKMAKDYVDTKVENMKLKNKFKKFM